MKKLLLTALAVMATVSIYAQGSVLFNNSATTLVQLKDGSGNLTTAPAGSTYTVGLWWATAGTTDDSVFTFSGQTATLAAAGRFAGLTKIIPGITPAGAVVAIQVRGWQTDAGSYDAAAASTDKYWGKSTVFSVDTGDSTSVPPGTAGPIIQAAGAGFQGLTLQIVPEPSTIALGLLGLAGLFVLRRRS